MALPYESSPAAKPIGSAPAGPVKDASAPPEDADHEAKLDGADRLIAATEAGDREAVAAAFEDMYRICALKAKAS